MPQPPQDVDTLFEDVLKDLPPETVEDGSGVQSIQPGSESQNARTVAAVCAALLWAGYYRCARWRATSGVLEERITDSAVAARLEACQPWVR